VVFRLLSVLLTAFPHWTSYGFGTNQLRDESAPLFRRLQRPPLNLHAPFDARPVAAGTHWC
jgi:hypothetical protein